MPPTTPRTTWTSTPSAALMSMDHRWDHQTLSRKHHKDMTNAAGTFDHRTRSIPVTDFRRGDARGPDARRRVDSGEPSLRVDSLRRCTGGRPWQPDTALRIARTSAGAWV